MAQKSRRNIVVGSCHAIDKYSINDSLQIFLFLFKVVKPFLVKQLAQKLKGRLRSIFLLDRHVQVINKSNQLRAGFRPQNVLASSFVQLAFDLLLHLAACGPRTEYHV